MEEYSIHILYQQKIRGGQKMVKKWSKWKFWSHFVHFLTFVHFDHFLPPPYIFGIGIVSYLIG